MSQIIVPAELHISLIVATDTDRAIGKNGLIPWGKHKGDMRAFRNTTKGQMVLMGRGTWESIGSKPLPSRHNIILSGSIDPMFFPETPPVYPTKDSTSLQLVSNLQEAIDRADNTRSVVNVHTGDNPVLHVIGGQSVYEAFLPYARTVVHNVIKTRVENPDRDFPEMAASDWELRASAVEDETATQLGWKQQIYARR